MSASPVVPAGADIDRLRLAAAACTACPLADGPTQTVFSEGPVQARIVFIGEQPGDVEDRLGRPFVGPAGKVLDRALADLSLRREDCYITNTVKHFRFSPSPSGRRIHQTPTADDVANCRPWLDAELRICDPELIVTLGATAGTAFFGPGFRVTRERGKPVQLPGRGSEPYALANSWAIATIHPSAVLRADDSEAAYDGMRADIAAGLALIN